MTQKAPGKHYRTGLTLIQLMDMFPSDDAATTWFEGLRWGKGRFCPHCGGHNTRAIQNAKPMPYRCRDCREHFSVRSGTVMERSRIPLRKWAIAIYLHATNIKGVSSMKLHRDLGITQKSAWFMSHRIRETFDTNSDFFTGPVEVDETYIGGKAKNMHKSKREKLTGRGGVDKEIVVGIKDRKTNKVKAKVVKDTKKETLHEFIHENVDDNAEKYTDENRSYNGLNNHEAVNHGVG